MTIKQLREALASYYGREDVEVKVKIPSGGDYSGMTLAVSNFEVSTWPCPTCKHDNALIAVHLTIE